MITVTLDAGHYGKRNRSPVIDAYYESERMWVLQGFLTEKLTKKGFKVVCTRSDPAKDLEATKRGRKAADSDLFISLHSNACDSESVSRVSIYRAYDNKNNASLLANALGRTIAETMGVTGYRDKTRSLAFGVGEYYGVMRGARAAGCPLYFIAEHSFHTNTYAASWLMSDKNLRALAKAEADTVAAYFLSPVKLALTDNYRIRGFDAGISVLDAKKLLVMAGIDAAIYKDDEDILCTGDAVYIGSEVYTVVITGDGNCDGEVSDADAVLAKRAALGLDKPQGAVFEALDINGDGKIGADDYLALKRMVRSKG